MEVCIRMREKLGWKRRECALALGFSLLFALSCALGRHVVYSGDIYAYPSENYMTALTAADLLLIPVAAAGCLAALMLLCLGAQRFTARDRRFGRPWPMRVLCFLLLLLAWLPYLLSYVPGLLFGDALSTLIDYLEAGYPTSNHHPILYTYLLGWFYRLGLRFGSPTGGLYLLTLFQAFAMAAVFTHTLDVLRRCGAGRLYCLAALLLYMFFPVFPAYALSFWKDPLFTCALLELSIELYACARLGGLGRGSLLRLLLFSLLSCFLRNNGVYVVAAVALLLPLCIRGRRLTVLLCFAVLMAGYFLVTGAGYRRFGIRQEFVESVGVPLQQLAAAVCGEGTLREEDEAFLYALLPDYAWPECYTPCIVDTIKWSPRFDGDFLEQNKGAFLRVWLRTAFRNPDIAARAWLLGTHGFWRPWGADPYGYYAFDAADLTAHPALGLRRADIWARLFGRSVAEPLGRYRLPVGSGTLLWLTAAAFTLCLIRKSRAWLAYVPALGNWFFVMLSTPCAYSLRYVCIMLFALPLLLFLPLRGNACPPWESAQNG